MTSPFRKRRLTMAPRFSSRNVPETPLKTGICKRSSASNPCPSGSTAIAVPTTFLLVSAPVGQETMHSPQEMQVESPIGELRSKAMPAEYPRSEEHTSELQSRQYL